MNVAQMAVDEDNDNVDNQNNSDGEDDVRELEFLLYFKTCIVERDLEILKIKLSQSIEMRESLIKKSIVKFHLTFPFYFVQPTLVSEILEKMLNFSMTLIAEYFQILYDYQIRHKSLDPDALCYKWPDMKKNVLICLSAGERDRCLKWFNDDIGYFLALLKLLTPSTAHFEDIVGKFVIFSDVRNNNYIFQSTEILHKIQNSTEIGRRSEK